MKATLHRNDLPTRLFRSERGSVLPAVSHLMAVIAVGLGGYMQISRSSIKLPSSSFYIDSATKLADVGLEQARWSLDNDRWTDAGFSQSSGTSAEWQGTFPSSTTCFEVGQGARGQVKVQVDAGGRNPHAVARAILTLSNGTELVKEAEFFMRRRFNPENSPASKTAGNPSGSNPGLDNPSPSLAPDSGTSPDASSSIGAADFGLAKIASVNPGATGHAVVAAAGKTPIVVPVVVSNTTSKGAASLDNIADLRTLSVSGLTTGYQASVLGYYVANDGGGGLFRYDPTSTASDNRGTIIQPRTGRGRWLRANITEINVRWFGAVGNGVTDDSAAVLAAIAASPIAPEFGAWPLYFPAGGYFIGKTTLVLDGPFTIRGDGASASYIRYVGTGAAIQIGTGAEVCENAVIRDIAVYGFDPTWETAYGHYGIIFGPESGAHPLVIHGVCENVTVGGFTVAGIVLNGCVSYRFTNLGCFYNEGDGLIVGNAGVASPSNTNTSFDRCAFVLNGKRGLYAIEGAGFSFYDCNFEMNGWEGVSLEKNEGLVLTRWAFWAPWFEHNQQSPSGEGAYAAQFQAVNGALTGTADGCDVDIYGGYWQRAGSESNGGKLNRLWVVQNARVRLNDVNPPAMGSFADGVILSDFAGNGAQVRHTSDYAPYRRSPACLTPIPHANELWNVDDTGLYYNVAGDTVYCSSGGFIYQQQQ